MVTAKRARVMGLVVLVVMFAIGALTGAATMRVTGGDQAQASERAESRKRPGLFETLELTPEQRTQVDAIMERRRGQVEAFWKTNGPQLRAIMDSARAEIRTVLTPEQRELEEQFRAERRQHYERH
ncbi:MAG TPA: periplasmic heavy metal sensor [Longimicrobiales bacterium]|nr:periplasmic heavy metal sensor [Longimicrobiales bacterium]